MSNTRIMQTDTLCQKGRRGGLLPSSRAVHVPVYSQQAYSNGIKINVVGGAGEERRHGGRGGGGTGDVERLINLEVRLMYSANEGDLDEIRELLDSDFNVNVNFKDSDGRTALHGSE
ncbi:hypothetical protein SO802_032579 [Lithocarpus litseifolius]|uniref:Uncharacterized protein n=1 Tax=Lithocarpus litseifolius TaxID=425828 RepID=A0AAW2BDM8_9ROSI